MRDRRVVGMIWLDGFASRSFGYYLRHYLPRLVSSHTWMRLARRTAKRMRTSSIQAIEPMTLREFPTKEMLRRGLRTLADAGVRMLLIYSGGVRRYYNHQGQLQRTLGTLGSPGQVVEGLDFHRFYFDLGGIRGPHRTTMCSPRVRLMGDVAVVAYARLVQRLKPEGGSATVASTETRVWQRQGGGWRHVHFHRTPLS